MDGMSRDALMYFALMLDLDELAFLCNSSTRYNDLLCANDDFWKRKLLNDYGILSNEVPEGQSHKSYYKELLDYVPGTYEDAAYSKHHPRKHYLPLNFFVLELKRLERDGNRILNMNLNTFKEYKLYLLYSSRYIKQIRLLKKNVIVSFKASKRNNRKETADRLKDNILNLSMLFKEIRIENRKVRNGEGNQQDLDNVKERLFTGLRNLEQDYAKIVHIIK